MPPLPAASRKTSRNHMVGLQSAEDFCSLSSKCKTIRPGTVKGPKIDPERDQKANATTETKFTLLPYRTCILYYFLFLFFCYYFIFYFYFFHLVFIVLFVWFQYLNGFLCSPFHIAFWFLFLHLYSNNTLLLVFYFLFFLFRSYISCHIIVVPIPT